MPRASGQAMLPPPAPTELTATIGIAVARPKTSARTRRSGSPRWITATSKLVPPMSAAMTPPRTAAPASARAAPTPPPRPHSARGTVERRRDLGLVKGHENRTVTIDPLPHRRDAPPGDKRRERMAHALDTEPVTARHRPEVREAAGHEEPRRRAGTLGEAIR